jgi:hypothetical protein
VAAGLLEEHGVSSVMAGRRSDTLSMPTSEKRAGATTAAFPARVWRKISARADSPTYAALTAVSEHASMYGYRHTYHWPGVGRAVFWTDAQAERGTTRPGHLRIKRGLR